MPKSFLVRNYFKNEKEDEMNNAVETSEVEELKLPQALENSHLSGVDSLPDLFESLEHARSLLALSRSVPWDYEIEKSYWFDTQNSHVTSSHNNDIIPSSSSEKSDSPSSHYGDVFQDLSKTEIDNIEKAATSIVSVIRSADLACRNDHGMVKTAEEAIIEEKPKNKTYLQMVCEALPLPPKMDFVDFPKIVVESEESSESLDSWSDLELKLQQMLSEENEQVSKNIRQFLDNNRIVTDEVAVETGMEKCDIDGFVDNCNDMELENKKELYRWYLTKILRPPTEHDDSYTCYKCGKIFTYKNYLERHIKYVCPDSTGRTWKCGYCGKAFQYPCYLRRHIRSHTGESPYKCDKCDRAFVRSTDLQRHIRNHTGEKPYQCTQCSRAFARSTDLKRHMRTHTGEKPYKCWQCRKSFSQSGSLQTHLQTHNKEMAKRSKQPTPNKSCRGTGL